MKTETREHTVPAKTTTYEVYVCDVPGCTFQTQDKSKANAHHGEVHAPLEIVKYSSVMTLARFQEETAFKEWHRKPVGWGTPRWDGPGWYVHTDHEVPCGRGCCTRQADQYMSLRSWIREQYEEIDEQLDDVKGLLRKIQQGSCLDESSPFFTDLEGWEECTD